MFSLITKTLKKKKYIHKKEKHWSKTPRAKKILKIRQKESEKAN